ncbi:hypothetical protein PLICRDRAFT_32428 [Plicaturopsis crispa FD-325 SS-3]|uniref:Uncharacterized protein n=1 Tax=Plicaturopsis crispa FD-325 SS-3 TaxID=944288 RepID=A0A0C9T4Y0_PLICR|nr:hypothetical protein PLICRDRAFT_32428 [Plicaturopsis crispa FD-325 SS-3]
MHSNLLRKEGRDRSRAAREAGANLKDKIDNELQDLATQRRELAARITARSNELRAQKKSLAMSGIKMARRRKGGKAAKGKAALQPEDPSSSEDDDDNCVGLGTSQPLSFAPAHQEDALFPDSSEEDPAGGLFTMPLAEDHDSDDWNTSASQFSSASPFGLPPVTPSGFPAQQQQQDSIDRLYRVSNELGSRRTSGPTPARYDLSRPPQSSTTESLPSIGTPGAQWSYNAEPRQLGLGLTDIRTVPLAAQSGDALAHYYPDSSQLLPLPYHPFSYDMARDSAPYSEMETQVQGHLVPRKNADGFILPGSDY